MSSRKKRTIDELSDFPPCLEFIKFRSKLCVSFYYAIRDESLAQLCLIEGAIQTHKIDIIRSDTLNALWFLFSSIYKRSFIVSNEEITLYKKFFDILLENNGRNLDNIRDSVLEVIWFLDEEILKRRLLQIIQACVLPLLSFSDCHSWIRCLQKERKFLAHVKNEVGMEENSMDDVIQLFQSKRNMEYIYLLEKKLGYVCPTIVMMIAQLNF